jgi:hypothetical protein
MDTDVLIERNFLGSIVRQNSKNGFICANDIEAAGNKYKALNGLKLFKFRTWIDNHSNKEFIKKMEAQFGNVIETKRGYNGATWMHPYICIDLALSIEPKLKVEVYKWLYDELLKHRNNSGDSYKKMYGGLYLNCSNKSTFNKDIISIEKMIKEACNVTDWQKASEDQLKLRNLIHENIFALCGVLRDNDQAVSIGISKAKESN